jgi:hypothetical protein
VTCPHAHIPTLSYPTLSRVYAGLVTTFAAVPLVNLIYPPHKMREDHNRQVAEQQKQQQASAEASQLSVEEANGSQADATEGFFPEDVDGEPVLKRSTSTLHLLRRRNVVCLATDPLQAASLTTIAALVTGARDAAASSTSTLAQVLLMHCQPVSEVPSSYMPHMDSLSTFAAGDAMRLLPAELVRRL